MNDLLQLAYSAFSNRDMAKKAEHLILCRPLLLLVGWHHQLNGLEFEQTLGDIEGQGSLACCSPLGLKELDTTERLNNNNSIWGVFSVCLLLTAVAPASAIQGDRHLCLGHMEHLD